MNKIIALLGAFFSVLLVFSNRTVNFSLIIGIGISFYTYKSDLDIKNQERILQDSISRKEFTLALIKNMYSVENLCAFYTLSKTGNNIDDYQYYKIFSCYHILAEYYKQGLLEKSTVHDFIHPAADTFTKIEKFKKYDLNHRNDILQMIQDTTNN
ncbi:MAG: hypothetical protein PHR62_10195 [Paludibacter sp.]|nr:hypothetical protein [Paludibacter sp.]